MKSFLLMGFTVNRLFMKLFQASNTEIVKCCQSLFGCELRSVLLTKRYDKFIGTVTKPS